MNKFIISIVAALLVNSALIATDFVVPQQKIVGAESPVPLGELVDLTVSPIKDPPKHFVSCSIAWKVFDGDKEIAAQLKAAESEDLRVLFCIGESVQADDFDALRKLLKAQLEPLAHRSLDLVIAYEPVFSIGVGGVPADPQYVNSVLTIIKEELSELTLAKTPLLYGGSVDVHNAALYGALKACDGLFVGRSAWSAEGYKQVFLNGYEAFKEKV